MAAVRNATLPEKVISREMVRAIHHQTPLIGDEVSSSDAGTIVMVKLNAVTSITWTSNKEVVVDNRVLGERAWSGRPASGSGNIDRVIQRSAAVMHEAVAL